VAPSARPPAYVLILECTEKGYLPCVHHVVDKGYRHVLGPFDTRDLAERAMLRRQKEWKGPVKWHLQAVEPRQGQPGHPGTGRRGTALPRNPPGPGHR